ncbi:hypothetical protein DFH11DRAFT_1592755 [Phellopilus nigrolimitatus]|nr:hypothetical protein DFH11DRAFT_1592755 [Phellopilus nigrolimitatus]
MASKASKSKSRSASASSCRARGALAGKSDCTRAMLSSFRSVSGGVCVCVCECECVSCAFFAPKSRARLAMCGASKESIAWCVALWGGAQVDAGPLCRQREFLLVFFSDCFLGCARGLLERRSKQKAMGRRARLRLRKGGRKGAVGGRRSAASGVPKGGKGGEGGEGKAEKGRSGAYII